ncbi:Do family serine endopeptidase [bacterium]|nr:Do family serine endopeptidase [bacterium]MBU1958518.1 Do family serine endopeptidase [bacterium]
MKKSIWLSALLSASLLAGNIEFEHAPAQPEHKLPNSKNEILSFNSILKESMNAVVNISTKTITQNQQSQHRLFNDPFFQEFFGHRGQLQNPSPLQKKQDLSLGSGVIISKDGYIVTNHHVIADADEIVVTVNNSDQEYIAKLIGTDQGSDLAVIKIEAQALNPIAISNADDIKLGDVVFAIGNPFGVGQTVTQGIISALNKNHVGINQYENFIQTDASINPGNSGGALIDSRGALIGINSAILSKSGGNHGIGFTIPIDMVQNIVSKLIEKGKVNRGFMGVNISKVTKDLQNLYNHKKGAIITDIQSNSPAQTAQLQRGDLIYEVNGKKVNGPYDLQRLVSSHDPNEVITLSLERDKQNIKKKLTLMGNDPYSTNSKSNIVVEGLYLSQLTDKLKETYQIPSNVKGVLIEDVKAQSSAHRNGFRPGDILIQIENMSIETIEQAKEAFSIYKGRTKRVYINRGGYIILLVTQ